MRVRGRLGGAGCGLAQVATAVRSREDRAAPDARLEAGESALECHEQMLDGHCADLTRVLGSDVPQPADKDSEAERPEAPPRSASPRQAVRRAPLGRRGVLLRASTFLRLDP